MEQGQGCQGWHEHDPDGWHRPAQPAQVKVERRDQTRVEVSVQTGADGLLVLGDPWYPQWRIEVDGRPAELLRADPALRGVRVPAGSHRVVFTYEDRALQAGLIVSLLTAAALAGLWWWRRRRGRTFRNVTSAP